jgi:hypothetical protein
VERDRQVARLDAEVDDDDSALLASFRGWRGLATLARDVERNLQHRSLLAMLALFLFPAPDLFDDPRVEHGVLALGPPEGDRLYL